MGGQAVIVFSFPEPEDNMEMGIIIAKAKKVFEDMPRVQAHLAIKDAADAIMNVLIPADPAESNGEG